MPQISRRTLLCGGAAFVGATACGRRKGTGYPGYALIATRGQKSVAVVDLTAFRLVKSIPVPGEPASVISTPEGGAYVLLADTGGLAFIGPDLQVARTHRIAGKLSALRSMSDAKRLVAIDPDTHDVLTIDAASFRVENRRRLHESPASVDVSRDGSLIVTASENGAINLLNANSGEWKHAQLKPSLGEVRFRSDGEMILVGNPRERILTALRVPDLAVIAELPLAMEPSNLCFTPDGGQLFVSGEGMDAVAIVFPYNSPYNAPEVEQTVLVGPDPGPMACSNDPGYLFVGSEHGSDVSIMQVDTRKSVGTVNLEAEPTYLTLTPDGQYALVLCENAGELAVIRVGAIRATRSKTGVALFTMLPVGERPVHCGFVPRQLA